MLGSPRPTPHPQRALAWVTALVAVLAMLTSLDSSALPGMAALSARPAPPSGAQRSAPAARSVGVTSSAAPSSGPQTPADPQVHLGESAAPQYPRRVIGLGMAGPAHPVVVPQHRLAWGATEEELAAATDRARSMSLEQVAGQVLVATYPGPAPETARDLVATLHLAGVILMGDNVVDADQVRATTAAVQQAVAADGRTWPAFIAVDQEGGPIARLGGTFTAFPSFMSAGAAHSPEVIRAASRASGTELRAAGFTVDLAPVADVTIGPADPVIGVRSAGGDPETAAPAVVAAQRGYRDAGLLTAVKHFPGHGSVTVDSHLALPSQDRSIDVLAGQDLPPFKQAIDAGAPMVMLGHIVVRAVDPDRPASLSPAVYGMLRTDLGFSGVTITDALNMAAATGGRTSGPVAVDAMLAGADLLLMPADVAEAQAALVAAVQAGTLPRARLDEAAGRVIAMMRLQAGWQARLGPIGPEAIGTFAAASEALSAAAVTVLDGPCSGALVGPTVSVAGGSDRDRSLFADAATSAGLVVAADGDPAATRVILLGASNEPASGDVVVSLDAPYALAGSTANARIALYGRTPEAFTALVAVLTGRATARGLLPAAVGDFPLGSGCRA